MLKLTYASQIIKRVNERAPKNIEVHELKLT